MRRSMGLMYQSQQEDRLRMSRIEERLNAGPTYSVASSRPISHSAVSHSACATAYVPPPQQYQPQPIYNGQSLREVRADPMVSAAVKQQCHMLESSPIGISTVNSKKARGLMRAGGEAAKTLYTDWPTISHWLA
jgi:hypothetical protein